MPPLPGPDRPGPPASPGGPAPAEAGPEAGAEAGAEVRAAARSDARAGDAAPGAGTDYGAGTDDGPAGGTRRGTVEGLRDALSGLLRGSASDGAVTAEDLADVLWVARLAGLDRGPGGAGTRSGAEAGTAGAEVPPGSAPRPGGEAPEDAAGDAPAPSRSPGTGSQARPGAGPEPVAPPPDAAEPRVGLHPYAAALPAGPHLGGTAGRGATGSAAGGGAGAAVHAVRVPQPPALSGALDLARALRPLRQSVEAPGAPLLDEDATAQASGEAGRGRLVPVWRPPVRRRFSVDLLVDTGATMAVWHRLGAELCTLLERHGAFADVRCWSLDTDAAVPRLAPFRRAHRRATAPGAQRSPRPGGRGARWAGALEDATGRRVLLVLTDGVGPAWYGSALPEFLARVAGERPAAALQVLPRRLWHRTALRTVPVELRMPDPARPVPAVRTDAALPGRPAPRSVRWLPVMEVDGAWLAPWAELVAGRAPGWSPMLAAPVRGVPVRRRAVAEATPEAPPPDPAERVARFRSGASPDAFRLACHLAAAPLSLPVMRLVQQATMPGSAQTDLAELFVSGLITRRDAGPGPEADPDEVVYDFVPGVRAELLAELTRSESLRVLDDVLAKVSGRIAATFGGTLDFRALAVSLDAALAATPPAPPSAPSPHGDLAARNAGDVDGESAAPAGEAAPADARRVRRDEKVAEGRGTADADAADQAARAEATGATGDARAYAAAASAGGGAGRGGPAAEAAAAGSASAEGSAGVPGTGTTPPMRVLPEASLPFAEVAVAVLNGAGGRHRALARRLAAAVEATVTPPAPASATRSDDAARLRADSSATAPVPPPAANAAPGAPSTPEPGRDVAELPAAGTRSAPEADVARTAEPVTTRDAEVSRLPAGEGESAPGTGASPAAAEGADPPDPPDPRDESNRADRTDRADRARRGGLAGSGGGRASTPGVAYPHRLVAVPRLRVPPDREELIGRAPELARLRELSDPEAASGTRPRVVVVEGRLGMGARRLVQEYARRYGDRHSFVHWVDAGRPESLHAGLGLLAAALGPGQDPAPGPVPPRADPSAPRGDSPVVPEAWRRLTRYEGWLVVLDDLGPAYDLGAPGVLPAVGRGVVLVTTTRLYDGRGRADAVITLEPLSRAEIADHVRREVGPDLLARDERRPHVLNRLVARLSSLPGELARVDVRAEFTRELELSRRAGPSPLYRWQTGSAVLSLAGMRRDVLAVATAGRPVTVYELAGGAVTSRLLNDSGATATALAALPGRGIGTGLAVSDGGPTVELLGFPYGTRTVTLRADAVPPAQGPRAEGAPAQGSRAEGPADRGPAADDRWTEAYGVPVERADGRIVTIRSSVTLLTAVPLGDGRSALAAGGPLPLRLWDAGTGAAIPTGLTERVRSIRAMAAFTGPGGDPVLAVVTRAGAAQLWDVREARRLTSPLTERLRGATSIVSVRLAGRPELLAAIDGGPMVRLWDTATGEAAGELHTGGLSALVALGVLGSARGDSRLVTATADGTVQVWDLGAFVEPPDPYAAAPARDASPTSSVPAGADAEPAGTAGADREGGGAASDGVLFAAWVVHEVSGTGAMSSDVLALVLGGAALVDSAVEAGTLRREGRDRVAVAPARLPEVVAVRRGERRRTEVLVALLTRSLPMPTSDVATWRPYDTMRPVLERLFPYLLSAEGMAAGGVGPADVLGLLTRWAWYLLLRGRYSTVASVAERVAAQVEDVLRRRGGTDRAGTADGDDGHGDSSAALTDLSAQLNRISLRARLALGDGPGVTYRARAISEAAPHGGDDVLEGLLAEAEIAVWRGEFDAPALSAAAGLRGSPPGPPEREATAGSDDQLEQRRRLLLARAAMFRGRLGEAARWLDLARATAVRMERRAEEEARAAAELAERAAGAARPAGTAGTAGAGGAGGTERRTGDRADIPASSSGSAASSASLADDPAFRPVWLASGAVDVLAVEYALIHAELGAAGGPGGRRLPAAAEPSFLDAPRLRLWPYTLPSPRPRHPAVIHGVGIAVPDVHLTLYLTLTQQYGLLLVRQDAVSPWDGSPRSPEDRPRAYDSARTALYEAEPHVTRQRPLMFVAHMATLGEIELAGPVPARARDHLEKARLAAEEAYGPRCPLLPRIGLLQAGALYREGAPSAAADRLRKVGDLLYDLHGDTPHQDRVALLRAWAALERDRATADRLSGTADAMAEALAAGADADAGAGRDAP